MELQVILANKYGRDIFYPDNNNAQLLCQLLGSKSLTKDQLKLCKQGGWQVIIKTKEYELD